MREPGWREGDRRRGGTDADGVGGAWPCASQTTRRSAMAEASSLGAVRGNCNGVDAGLRARVEQRFEQVGPYAVDAEMPQSAGSEGLQWPPGCLPVRWPSQSRQ